MHFFLYVIVSGATVYPEIIMKDSSHKPKHGEGNFAVMKGISALSEVKLDYKSLMRE